MQIFNTLTRQKEEFVPQVPGEYRIYVCGPTVYNYIHIGNARPLIVFDTLRRYLEYRGNKVIYVSNITDIDDKLIKKGQEEVYLQTGYANIKEQKEISRDTIFRLFSMTKPVTAAAVMLLFQRGLLDLTDPVEKFIPGFQNQMVSVQDRLEPVWHPMSIWNLLSMTSGLTYGGESTVTEYATGKVFEEIEKRLYSDTPVSTLEFADMIGRCPLEFQPGTNWKYGVSADILAAVVEKVSG